MHASHAAFACRELHRQELLSYAEQQRLVKLACTGKPCAGPHLARPAAVLALVHRLAACIPLSTAKWQPTTTSHTVSDSQAPSVAPGHRGGRHVSAWPGCPAGVNLGLLAGHSAGCSGCQPYQQARGFRFTRRERSPASRARHGADRWVRAAVPHARPCGSGCEGVPSRVPRVGFPSL